MIGNPWRQLAVPDTLVRREDESPTFTSNCAHEREPCVSAIGSWSKVDVHVLRIQTLSKERHEVFPANRSRDGKLHSVENGCDSFERRWRALAPDKALRSSLLKHSE